MKVLVLKDFPYAEDGLKSKTMVAGTEPEIRDEFVLGLEQEGFIVVGLPKPTDGAGSNERAPAYDKMDKKLLIETATNRGIDGRLKPKEIIALLERADKVDALVLTSNYADLTDDELAKVAADRKVEVPAGASREDIIALLMPVTTS